ncbi:MAG: diguanylate cyclase [Campylobacterales bacterium]
MKVLIVDDNIITLKLVAKTLGTAEVYEPVMATSLAEARDRIQEHGSFFAAIVDLDLLDTHDDEIVDLVLSHGIPTIVLTANMDEELRQRINTKPIVDYVLKDNADSFEYLLTVLEALCFTRRHKALICDDSIVSRRLVRSFLSPLFPEVYEAKDGKEGLAKLAEHPETRLVVTDYNMPVMDGLEMITVLRQNYPSSKMGVLAITASEKEGLAARFLKSGADDLVSKKTGKEEFLARVMRSMRLLAQVERIEELSITDPLTRLFNRRHFNDYLPRLLKRTAHSGKPLMFAILDVDNFKKYNDTYGHIQGDEVLRTIGKILRDSCRPGQDVAYRLGGEEFAIVSTDTDTDGAMAFLERMRRQIQECNIEHRLNGAGVVTASFGFVVARGGQTVNPDLLYTQADEALYRAKKNGRNRVERAVATS